MGAIATRLEAIASRLEAIRTCSKEAITTSSKTIFRLEAIASRLEAIASRLEVIATSNSFRFLAEKLRHTGTSLGCSDALFLGTPLAAVWPHGTCGVQDDRDVDTNEALDSDGVEVSALFGKKNDIMTTIVYDVAYAVCSEQREQASKGEEATKYKDSVELWFCQGSLSPLRTGEAPLRNPCCTKWSLEA